MGAPLALIGIGCGLLAGLAWAIGFAYAVGPGWVLIPVLFTLVVLTQFGLCLHATRRGKFRGWAALLDEIGPRGGERVLGASAAGGARYC